VRLKYVVTIGIALVVLATAAGLWLVHENNRERGWEDPLQRQGIDGLQDVSNNEQLGMELSRILAELEPMSTSPSGIPEVMTDDLSMREILVCDRELKHKRKAGTRVFREGTANDYAEVGTTTWSDGVLTMDATFITYPPSSDTSYLKSVSFSFDRSTQKAAESSTTSINLNSLELGKSTQQDVVALLGKPDKMTRDEEPEGPLEVTTTYMYYGEFYTGEKHDRLTLMFNREDNLVIAILFMWGLEPLEQKRNE